MDLNFHGTEDRLEQYALGRLPGADLIALEEHLLICDACRERLDDIGAFAIGMREALSLPPEVAPAAASRDWFAWLRRPVFAMAIAGARGAHCDYGSGFEWAGEIRPDRNAATDAPCAAKCRRLRGLANRT